MIYDVTVNGVSITTLGVSLFERRLPVLPEAEEHTVKIAGSDGVVDFGSTYTTRMIGLTLEINTRPEQYHATLAKVARIFNAKRGDITLEFSDMPGKYYRATYAGTLALNGSTGSRLYDVTLRMNDPWPSGKEQVTEVTITASPQTIEIASDADVPAKPIIVLTNTGANVINGFTITNEYIIE
jgi:phage-related protein